LEFLTRSYIYGNCSDTQSEKEKKKIVRRKCGNKNKERKEGNESV
jgi:hypothetical protein